MKKGHKIMLFSSMILTSVVAGTVSVHADVNEPTVENSKPRPVAKQIIEKQDHASAEDLAVAKEIFAEAATPTPATERAGQDFTTEIIEKQDVQTEADRAVAKEIFAKATDAITPKVEDKPALTSKPVAPAPAETSNKEEPASVTVSLDKSVATVHYDRPVAEAKITILHYVWSAKADSDQASWVTAGQTDTKIDLDTLGGYGTYNINSYKEIDGNLMLFNKTSVIYKKVEEKPATPAKPHVDVTSHVNGDTLTVELKRGQDLGKALVQYAVWSDEKGQDDVQWYVASQTTKIDLSKHKGYGKYHLHTYAWLNGQAVGLASSEFIYLKSAPAKPVVPKAEKSSTLAAQGTYHFTGRASIKNEAKVSSPEVAYFDKGMSVYYDKVLENDGHQWLGYVSYSGMRHYVDLGTLATTSPENVATKPAPKAGKTENKPEEKVEKTGTVKPVTLPASGTYTFKERASIKSEPKVTSAELAYYDKGMSVNYDKTLVADGRQWLSYMSFAGHRRYVDLGAVSKEEVTKPAVKPISTKPVERVENKKVSLPTSGTYTFAERSGIKSEPKVSAQDLAYYDKGQTVNYDKTLEADGKTWISYLSYSGNRRYIAVGNAGMTKPATPVQPTSVVKDEPTNIVAARLAFAQHGTTSNFDVEVTNLTGKGTVHFAVWNGQNDQDDLKWYDMKRVGDKFIGSFDMNQHRGNGPVYIHAYYQEAPDAKMQFVRGLQF